MRSRPTAMFAAAALFTLTPGSAMLAEDSATPTRYNQISSTTLTRGHSLANDESVWTPGQNAGKSIQFSPDAIFTARPEIYSSWRLVPELAYRRSERPVRFPGLIVYHLIRRYHRNSRRSRHPGGRKIRPRFAHALAIISETSACSGRHR